MVQVGTWQRSDERFRLACEMVRSGRIGALKKVTVVLGKNVTGGPFAAAPVPPHLNWNLWQGQTPDVPYIPERCHYTFRWWQEYSGGQMTDWGAHHVDIALWGIGRDRSGPTEISGKARYPEIADGYNVPIDFEVRYVFEDGLAVEVADNGRNGVMFEGEDGRIFVNRGTVAGKPVDELESLPLPREDFKLYDFDNLERPPRRQAGRHRESHGQLLRLPRQPQNADFRRRNAAPFGDGMPPGEHRAAARPESALEPGTGAVRRRPGGG